jgi:putative tryptophan/tyrosine transport system ATP-binding protein
MLEMSKLTKVFNAGTPNEVRALQGVDCTLEESAFVVIIGTNGSGKSTLLNAVAGTFYVDAGSIFLDGIDVPAGPSTAAPA